MSESSLGDRESVRRKVLIADLQLFLAAVSFGSGFVGQKEADIEHVGPLTFNAVRFAISTVLIFALLPVISNRSASQHKDDDKLRHESKDQLPLLASISGEELHPEDDDDSAVGGSAGTKLSPQRYAGALRLLWYGTLLGIFNFLGSSLQQAGIKWLTSAESSFLTGLYVVFTPLVQVIAPSLVTAEHRPGLNTWIAVVLSLIGLFITSGSSLSSLKMGPGEILTLAASFFWTFFILLLDIATDRCNAMHITVVQLFVTTILSIVASYFLEHGEWNLHHLWASWPIMLFLGTVECVAFAFGAQGQIYAPPHHAAIIYSSETVWAIAFGYLFLGESLSFPDAVGCGFLIVATLCAKLDCSEPLKRFYRLLTSRRPS